MVQIKIKRVSETAKMPTKKEEDAGWDCYADSVYSFKKGDMKELSKIPITALPLGIGEVHYIGLGFKTEIPKGYYAQLVPRSGLAMKHGLTIVNSPATIDSGFRGEWIVILSRFGSTPYNENFRRVSDLIVHQGYKIAQFIIRKEVETEIVESDDLEESERGENGYGSSGV